MKASVGKKYLMLITKINTLVDWHHMSYDDDALRRRRNGSTHCMPQLCWSVATTYHIQSYSTHNVRTTRVNLDLLRETLSVVAPKDTDKATHHHPRPRLSSVDPLKHRVRRRNNDLIWRVITIIWKTTQRRRNATLWCGISLKQRDKD